MRKAGFISVWVLKVAKTRKINRTDVIVLKILDIGSYRISRFNILVYFFMPVVCCCQIQHANLGENKAKTVDICKISYEKISFTQELKINMKNMN